MQNNPAFQFFEYINGYPHTTRVYSRGNELHWVKTYVGHGEFHPTTIHTTSTSHSNGWLSIRSEVATPFGQQFILSSYCPVSSPSPLLRPPTITFSSRSSLQRTTTFGESTQLLRALRSEVDPRPLIERISGPEGQEITPSPCSPSPRDSLSAFEGNVHQQTASPTPDEIEEDLSHFPPSPPNKIEGIRVQVFEATLPPCSQINATITLCKAIVSYKKDNPMADDHVYVVTEGLDTFIKVMAEHNKSVPLPITHQEYNCITHLTYISSFTDAIEPYLIENKRPKTLLERLTTPSHISVSNDKELVHTRSPTSLAQPRAEPHRSYA